MLVFGPGLWRGHFVPAWVPGATETRAPLRARVGSGRVTVARQRRHAEPVSMPAFDRERAAAAALSRS
jgi:hypothetical protein